MAKRSLTATAIEKLKPHPSNRREIPDRDGLYFILQPSGKRSWAVRYRFGGITRKLTLGSYPAIGLVEARAEAAKAQDTITSGVDPIEAQRRAREEGARDRDLFENVVADFLRRTGTAGGRESRRLLDKEVLPRWRGHHIQDITKRDVIGLLDDLLERSIGVMANRVFAAIRRIFNWAVERDIIAVSPGHGLKPPVPEVSRDRVLGDDEIRWLWKAASDAGYPFGPIFKLLLLTGQRRSEVSRTTWREFDLDERMWSLPRERAKNDRQHDVFLSDQSLAVLEAVPKIEGPSGFMFTTNGRTPVTGFSRAKERFDEAMLSVARQEVVERGHDPAGIEIPDWRVHDLRRTTASGMARLGIILPVIEKVLNHISGSFAGIVGVYQRHSFADEKRVALEAWGRKIDSIVNDQPANNVVEPVRAGPG